MSKELTYASYLQIDDLLSLQSPRSAPAEHDEMLFIVIHQTYELWFKQLLHELEKVRRDFNNNAVFEAIHTFKRCRTIVKTLVGQVDILETMTPRSFSSFRERLDKASGFQSYQFREMEFFLGYKRAELAKHFKEGTKARDILKRRLAEPSLVHAFYNLLCRYDFTLPNELVERDNSEPNVPNEDVQNKLVSLYEEHPSLGILFELMTDFDEGLQEWRYRHVMLVARTIGAKHGTGGSLGVEFLKRSLFLPVFADLWAIRHRF